jgi:hypothetical protein
LADKSELEQAISMAQMGLEAAARDRLERIVRDDPSNLLALKWLVTVRPGDKKREVLEHILKLSPSDAWALRALADLVEKDTPDWLRGSSGLEPPPPSPPSPPKRAIFPPPPPPPAASQPRREIGSAPAPKPPKPQRSAGTKLCDAAYIEGLPRIGRQRIPVELVAHDSSLTVWKYDGTPLVSVPYTNLVQTRRGWVEKFAGGKFADLLIGAATGGGGGWGKFDGVWIQYEDVEIQREVRFFLAMGERKAKRIYREIWDYRDDFVRRMGE